MLGVGGPRVIKEGPTLAQITYSYWVLPAPSVVKVIGIAGYNPP